MKTYNPLTEILESNKELVSSHLSWISNAILEDGCGVNQFIWHKELEEKCHGKAIGLAKTIVINLERHFARNLERIQEDELKNTSIKTWIIRDIVDTLYHEKYHILKMEENEDWEKDRTVDEENKAKEYAYKKSFEFARDFDIEVTSFGPFLDSKLGELIEELHEDINDDEESPEWKKLQLYMLENNIGYYNPNEEIEYSIRKTFEAMAEHDEPWDADPKYVQPEELPTDTDIAPVDETTEDIATEDYIDYDMGYEDEVAISALPQTAAIQVTNQVTSPVINQAAPQVVNQAAPQANTIQPSATGTDWIPVKQITEQVLRRLFCHVFDKCAPTNDGRFANPNAVLEPVPISDIPGATELFTHMNTINEMGQFVNNMPISEAGGYIKGLTSDKLAIPYYKLTLNVGGKLINRTFIAQNPFKTKQSGELTKFASRAQQGVKIMLFMKEQGAGTTMHIERTPEQLPGQEEVRFWK
jgi:GTPase SAR1 family protein